MHKQSGTHKRKAQRAKSGTHKRKAQRAKSGTKRSTKRITARSRGGNYSIATVGEREGVAHKGLNKIVVAGPMGVMSGSAYEQFVQDLDQQGAE